MVKKKKKDTWKAKVSLKYVKSFNKIIVHAHLI